MQSASEFIIFSFGNVFEEHVYDSQQFVLIQLLELCCKAWDLVTYHV